MIIFLFGQDSYRAKQKLKELKEKFKSQVDLSGSSLTVLDGATVRFNDLAEAIGPSSLLSKKRMIIVEEIFTNKNLGIFNQLLMYLKDSQVGKNDNIVIFIDTTVKIKKAKNKEVLLKIDAQGREKALVGQPLDLFKFLIKQKFSQHFNLLPNIEAASWIKKEIAKRGGSISHQALQLLASLIGNDLWQASNEIDKLLNYKAASLPKLTKDGVINLDVDDITNLVHGKFDENIFALTDAISNKNKAEAARLFAEQLDNGAAESYLLVMLTRQFKILLGVKQAQSQDQSPRKIASSLKLHPFVAQKVLAQVAGFSLNVLKDILQQLIKIDYLIKTGKMDVSTMFDILLAKI